MSRGYIYGLDRQDITCKEIHIYHAYSLTNKTKNIILNRVEILLNYFTSSISLRDRLLAKSEIYLNIKCCFCFLKIFFYLILDPNYFFYLTLYSSCYVDLYLRINS
jgi:hypothetical protein